MRKTIRRLAAWACCLCMAAGAVTAAWAQETDYAQMERELVEAQRQQLTGGEPLLTRQDVLPAGQSSVADWYAIAMARCGIGEDYETYLAALKTYVESAYAESGGLSANKATEWHRVALAVTALGGDAAAFGTKPDGTTIDLIADGCYDCVVEGGPGAQGLNGWIFALLALDAGGRAVYQRDDHRGHRIGAGRGRIPRGGLRFLRREQRDHLSLFLVCGRGAGGVAQDRGYGRAGLLCHVRRQRRGDGGSVAAQERKARITSHKRVKQRGQTPSLLLPIRNRAASADIGCIEP